MRSPVQHRGDWVSAAATARAGRRCCDRAPRRLLHVPGPSSRLRGGMNVDGADRRLPPLADLVRGRAGRSLHRAPARRCVRRAARAAARRVRARVGRARARRAEPSRRLDRSSTDGGGHRRATADSDVGSTVELQDSERRLLGAPALRLHCRGQDLARGPWLGLASWEALWAAP